MPTEDASTIVVGVDGSEGAAAALRWAATESALRSARLRAVLVWDYLNQRHVQPDAPFDPEYDDTKAAAALRDQVRHS